MRLLAPVPLEPAQVAALGLIQFSDDLPVEQFTTLHRQGAQSITLYWYNTVATRTAAIKMIALN